MTTTLNMKHSKLNLGFIGGGFIGQVAHIANFDELDSCQLFALAEMRSDIRNKVANRYGFVKQFDHHSELLSEPNIDAVVVVTPRKYTGPIVLDCLNAGKHVLSEKPMTGTVEQGIKLINAAKNNNCRYMVGYMKRYDPGVQQAKILFDELMVSGEIGKLLHINARCYMGDSYCNASGYFQSELQRDLDTPGWDEAPSWLTAAQQPIYARYLNVYSHVINTLQHFLVRQPSVDFFKYTSNISHTCILNYGEFIATLNTGEVSHQGWDESIEFIFEHGTLTITLPPALLRNVPAKVELYKAGNIQQVLLPQSAWQWSFANQAQQFVKDMLNNQESLIDARYALNDLALIENIWRAQS